MESQEIINAKHWQIIQDIFSSLIGISLRSLDAGGRIIVRPSNMPGLCQDMVDTNPLVKKKCWQWFVQLANHLERQGPAKYSESICPLGLVNIALPLSFNNGKSLYLIIGPVVFENSKNNIKLTSRIQELGMDEEKFFQYYNKLPSINATDISKIVESLNSIALFMSKLNDFELKQENEKFVFDQETIGALLKTFLELAMKLCNAEFGSVMIFEKNKKHLSIKEANHLSDEIINNTKIKPGEGIAGMSIERRKAMFINDQLNDRNIRLHMRKPKTKSAFVIPVFYKTQVLGVISVGTAKSPNNFSDKLMELLNELVGMALEKISLE